MKLNKRMRWEERQEIGRKLKEIYDYLLTLSVKTSNTYGVSKKAGKVAHAAALAVSAVQCELDNRVFAEHPGRDERELLHVYYGREEPVRPG